ncbi:MAG: LysE family transporter [Paenibacillus macerans]|uniref:LysE family translocator n=1 Tax=Paenibacillus macerans TaxID=44252 RepID=A0A090ZCC2_PAEMA|nr:LysE family transporter [Paenibacillus macerans]KFN08287.1 lysE type translocator family protein [Paenibacillus macerans]MBS5914002.1 LysE family transporter [Paenibacillus macerans]MCY7557581.1 LysE family transporter [Paenibacillus macerans]MDU7474746.1 LysE family transporter [Paenibacillus macerans]MEC0152265.1 LysE family transporter [Paenibacillus macerans]
MSLISFLTYCVIATFTPGPTNIAILSIAHHNRLKESFRYMWGATVAFFMLLSASAALNGLIATIVPKILLVMQIIGGVYMLYLAYQVYKMNLSENTAAQAATFRSGYVMQFVNPKIWLFTMSVIPGYVMPYYKSSLSIFAFVLAITVIAFLAFVTWALFGRMLHRFLQKYQKVANIALAVLLVYSAIEVLGIWR